MLFDPDMISWRERGPGQASLRTLPGLTQSPSPPPAHPPPAQAQLPSAPVLRDGQPPPGPDLPRGRSAGVRGGARPPREGLHPSWVRLQGLRWDPAQAHTEAQRPFLAEAPGVLAGTGATRISLTALLPAALRGPPPTRGGRAKGQSQQRLAEDSCKLRQVSRQRCPAESKATAFSVQLNTSRAHHPAAPEPLTTPPHQEGERTERYRPQVLSLPLSTLCFAAARGISQKCK